MNSLPRYAVFGHPIAHSLSPFIHAEFAKQVGIGLRYEAIESTAEGFAEALEQFAVAGGVGANITLPHKEAAFALCRERSERAERAGAANTLTRVGDAWHGDNTDGAGLVRDITERHRLDLRGRRALMLGAGGAARGVAPALLDAGLAELVIVNRSPDRADALVDMLGEPGRAKSRYWNDLGSLGDFELVINATSAGREQRSMDLPFGLVSVRCLAIDLSYGEAAIAFSAWARAAGCSHVIDGLGMLVEQAALAFEHWHGKRVDTTPVFAALQARTVALHTAD